jgi:hypothetical protein
VSDVISRAAGAIRQRLDELTEERTRLERALAGLDGASASGGSVTKGPRSRSRAAGRPASRQRRGTRGRGKRKRAARGERREQFLAAVKDQPGRTAAELARAIGVTPNQAHMLGRRARAEKAVSKRGARYYPRG